MRDTNELGPNSMSHSWERITSFAPWVTHGENHVLSLHTSTLRQTFTSSFHVRIIELQLVQNLRASSEGVSLGPYRGWSFNIPTQISLMSDPEAHGSNYCKQKEGVYFTYSRSLFANLLSTTSRCD